MSHYGYNVAGGANAVTLSISGATTRLGAAVREYRGFGTTTVATN